MLREINEEARKLHVEEAEERVTKRRFP